MFSLIGSILGFGTSFLPKVMEYFQDKKDKKHELDMMDKQILMQKELHTQKIDMVAIEADIREVEALQKSQTALTAKASQWVVNLSSSVRPVVTYCFFIEFAALTVAVFAGWIDTTQYNSIWNQETQAIWAAVVSFWFGSRELRKREGKA